MAQYYRVRPKYWKGDRRRWTDQEKLLGLYLLTCEHRNLEGLYWLPKGYVSTDLGWPAKVVDRAFETLIAAGFCEYDPDAEVVFVTAALAHQAPTTDKQVQGAVAALEAVPDTTLWDVFLAACQSDAPKLADALRDATPIASVCDSNGTPVAYVSDPDIARTRSSSSSSSSSSNSIPPSPPGGKRGRDILDYELKFNAWTAEHFPGVQPKLVKHCTGLLRSRGIEPTVDALRALVENGGMPSEEAA